MLVIPLFTQIFRADYSGVIFFFLFLDFVFVFCLKTGTRKVNENSRVFVWSMRKNLKGCATCVSFFFSIAVHCSKYKVLYLDIHKLAIFVVQIFNSISCNFIAM